MIVSDFKSEEHLYLFNSTYGLINGVGYGWELCFFWNPFGVDVSIGVDMSQTPDTGCLN